MYSDSEFDSAKFVTQFISMASGIYVDVGAGFPEHGYTAHTLFRNTPNWRIIAIEANPEMCKQYRGRGYEIYEYAATDSDLGRVSFDIYTSHEGLGGSCITSQNVQHMGEDRTRCINIGFLRSIEVTALTLNTILATHCPEVTHINVLNVDVEYSELQVLRGLDFEKYSPDIMIIECLGNNPAYQDYFDQLGYKVVAQAGPNKILIRK
jgi:FkbM family methyltransferase